MTASIFDNSNVCKVDDCEQYHCPICGSHIVGPVWGPTICSTCCQAMEEATENGTLTEEDLSRWNRAISIG